MEYGLKRFYLDQGKIIQFFQGFFEEGGILNPSRESCISHTHTYFFSSSHKVVFFLSTFFWQILWLDSHFSHLWYSTTTPTIQTTTNLIAGFFKDLENRCKKSHFSPFLQKWNFLHTKKLKLKFIHLLLCRSRTVSIFKANQVYIIKRKKGEGGACFFAKCIL